MSKYSKYALTFVTAALLTLTTAIQAQMAPAGQPAGPAGRILACLRVVNLTDAQKAQVKTILETARPALSAAAENLKDATAALRALMQADSKDACAIGNAVLAVEAAKDAMHQELVKVRTQIEAILTAEQKAMLAGCLAAPHPPRSEMAEEAAY